MRGRLSYDPTGIRALIRGRRNERGGGSSPSWNAFVLPRCTHSTVEPVQREPWPRRKRREPARQREAWIGFSHAISPTRSSQERVDRFRSPIWPSRRLASLVELSCFERISRCREPWLPVASSEMVPCFDASGLMFQANAGSYTLCR